MPSRRTLAYLVLSANILRFVPVLAVATNPGVQASACDDSGKACAPAGNEFCPVRPTEPGLEEYELEYAGQKIRFCCEPCMRAFKKNPQAYLKNLPQFEANPAELEEEPDSAASLMGQLSSEETRTQMLLFSSITAGLLLVTWLLRALFRRRGWRSGVRPGLMLVSGCVLLAAVVALYLRALSLNREIHQEQLKDLLHFATYHDFGEKPIPAKPPVPKRLKATFYRGNDERSPRLFNGGHYRTCTFQIALCDEGGRELSYGSDVVGHATRVSHEAGRRLGVRLEIERGPHTPDFFWTPDRMQRYFLTQRCDPFMGSEGPIADRVDLRTEQEMQRWSAWFPIDEAPPKGARGGSQDLAGIIYACEEFATPQRMYGARMHYAIQYDIHIREGRIDEQSDLWMGALYRTRKVLQWRLPLEQWFSHEPIPVLPKPSIRDPKLLGITDYTRNPKPGSEVSTPPAGETAQ
jgi:YHS domain-containing protein